MNRGDLAEALISQSFDLIEDEGPEALSLGRLHERMKGAVSKTAPLHHFGSMAGLYAAVAAQGFDNLTELLARKRESLPPSRRLIGEIAVTYGRFALEHENLYRTLHLPLVWTAAEAAANASAGVGAGGKERADRAWLREVEEARDRTFTEFVFAVQLGQAAGALRRDAVPRDIARVVTALVDGYLFQILVERVSAVNPLAELSGYVRLAINGLGQRRRPKT